MVQIATITVAIIAAMAPLAAADNCNSGLNYCGWNLLKKGNYYSQIDSALTSAGQMSDGAHINASLFRCTGGSNGAISFLKFCAGGCLDGGSGQSDYC